MYLQFGQGDHHTQQVADQPGMYNFVQVEIMQARPFLRLLQISFPLHTVSNSTFLPLLKFSHVAKRAFSFLFFFFLHLTGILNTGNDRTSVGFYCTIRKVPQTAYAETPTCYTYTVLLTLACRSKQHTRIHAHICMWT